MTESKASPVYAAALAAVLPALPAAPASAAIFTFEDSATPADDFNVGDVVGQPLSRTNKFGENAANPVLFSVLDAAGVGGTRGMQQTGNLTSGSRVNYTPTAADLGVTGLGTTATPFAGAIDFSFDVKQNAFSSFVGPLGEVNVLRDATNAGGSTIGRVTDISFRDNGSVIFDASAATGGNDIVITGLSTGTPGSGSTGFNNIRVAANFATDTFQLFINNNLFTTAGGVSTFGFSAAGQDEVGFFSFSDTNTETNLNGGLAYDNVTFVAVPEPTVLAAFGIAGLTLLRRRRV